MTIKISVSIVSYKSDLDDMRLCVESLLRSALFANSHGLNVDLILDIVNNYKNNDEINRLNEFILSIKSACVNLINSPKNGGYGYGNNISIEKNKNLTNYHLVINPDVEVDERSIFNAVRYMQANDSVGLLVPMIINQYNELQYLCKRNPTLLIMLIRSFGGGYFARYFPGLNSKFLMLDHDYTKEIRDVQYPSGCYLFFRTSNLINIGGFDERYFLHYEDADIGRKIRNYSVCVYRPDVIVTHAWARETHKSLKMKLITIISGFKYLIKWSLVKEVNYEAH